MAYSKRLSKIISLSQLSRLLLAFGFALPAFVFSELIPDIPPFPRTLIRIFITIWFWLLGYGVFPDVATRISAFVLHMSNQLIERLSNEITTRMIKVSRPNNTNLQTSSSGIAISSPLIVDTSSIIDGRIVDVAKSNFLYGQIIIPNFVLTELQQVADSSDFIKRSRGRKGFEIVDELKKIKGIRLEVLDSEIAAKEVDDKLIKLAKSLHGRILTTDYNLNKVATLSGITVLNINDLANSLKTIAVPGERLQLKLLHVGKEPEQGVGYLDDGTMVVVENGSEKIGSKLEVEITRNIQSSSGRMVFAKAS